MMKNFDEVQKIGKESMDVTMKSFSVISKGFQAIAVEMADYSKKSFEEGTAVVEKLIGAKTLEKAIEIQADYLRSVYEGFVAQSAKIGELYANLAKDAIKPYESLVAKAGK